MQIGQLSMTRRTFLVGTAGLAGAAGIPFAIAATRQRGDGHLTAKLRPPSISVAPGSHPLGLGSGRDGLLIVPRSYRVSQPAPLLVLLHGAGGRAARVAELFSLAEDLGVIVLAPESRDRTWDAIRGRFGPDIDFLNRALHHTFDRCAVDPRRVAIGGFSDGASYALSAGLASGDLFTHIVACSPGFIARSAPRGKPLIYMSHGTQDEILPIDPTSRRLRRELTEEGYNLTYREFNGPHAVPPAIAREALDWFVR
jgi:phospholipase/carboxylesterase